MEIRIFYIVILLLFINCEAKSQLDTNNISKNGMYLEIGGVGSYGSLNYERVIFLKAKTKIVGRIGVGTYSLTDYTSSFNPDIFIPITINGLLGKNHKIELGVGQTVSNTIQANHSNWKPERETNLHANFTIGYRYQKDKGGFIFRCSYTPVIEFYKYYRHWAGVSIGYAF